MDELSSAPPKRVTLAPRLGYEDSPREDAALVLEDAAQSRVTLAPRGEPLKEATEPSTPLTPPLTPPAALTSSPPSVSRPRGVPAVVVEEAAEVLPSPPQPTTNSTVESLNCHIRVLFILYIVI